MPETKQNMQQRGEYLLATRHRVRVWKARCSENLVSEVENQHRPGT